MRNKRNFKNSNEKQEEKQIRNITALFLEKQPIFRQGIAKTQSENKSENP